MPLIPVLFSILLLALGTAGHQFDHVRSCNEPDVFCFDVWPDYEYSYGRYEGMLDVGVRSLLLRIQVYRDRDHPERHVWNFDMHDPSLTGCSVAVSLIPSDLKNSAGMITLTRKESGPMLMEYRMPGAVKNVQQDHVSSFFSPIPESPSSSTHLSRRSTSMVSDHLNLETSNMTTRIEFLSCNGPEVRVVKAAESVHMFDGVKPISKPPSNWIGSAGSESTGRKYWIIGVSVMAVIALIVFFILTVTTVRVVQSTTSKSTSKSRKTSDSDLWASGASLAI